MPLRRGPAAGHGGRLRRRVPAAGLSGTARLFAAARLIVGTAGRGGTPLPRGPAAGRGGRPRPTGGAAGGGSLLRSRAPAGTAGLRCSRLWSSRSMHSSSSQTRLHASSSSSSPWRLPPRPSCPYRPALAARPPRPPLPPESGWRLQQRWTSGRRRRRRQLAGSRAPPTALVAAAAVRSLRQQGASAVRPSSGQSRSRCPAMHRCSLPTRCQQPRLQQRRRLPGSPRPSSQGWRPAARQRRRLQRQERPRACLQHPQAKNLSLPSQTLRRSHAAPLLTQLTAATVAVPAAAGRWPTRLLAGRPATMSPPAWPAEPPTFLQTAAGSQCTSRCLPAAGLPRRWPRPTLLLLPLGAALWEAALTA